jgi:hypothetical protein
MESFNCFRILLGGRWKSCRAHEVILCLLRVLAPVKLFSMVLKTKTIRTLKVSRTGQFEGQWDFLTHQIAKFMAWREQCYISRTVGPETPL